MRHSFVLAPLARALTLEFCVAMLLAGCGSSGSSGGQPPPSEGGTKSDSASPKDASPDVIIDPKNCVAPGAPGYCSPGGGQCDMAGPGGSAEICTADLGGTPSHDWFCTTPCSKPSECGSGTTCANGPMEMGLRCVPKTCDSFIPDSGPTDSGPSEAAAESGPKDSSTDGPHDGSTDGSLTDH